MPAPKLAPRARPQDVDRYVGARIHERRILLGLTQQQMAELIGVTYQHAGQPRSRAFVIVLLWLLAAAPAGAQDVAAGLTQALTVGTERVVAQLGKPGGFLRRS